MRRRITQVWRVDFSGWFIHSSVIETAKSVGSMRQEAAYAMTDAQITQLVTAITLAVVDALSTTVATPVAEVAPIPEPSAPVKAKKATKKAPKRTPEQNSALVKRINGRIANATKATTKGASYEEMIAVLATATQITPSGWVSTHNQIARKADKLAAVITVRDAA
jgi:hypothetical protein